MKRISKTVVSATLVFALVFSTLFVAPKQIDKVYAKTNQFGVVEGTAIDDQDEYDKLMDLIDHCDSPEDFACWTAKFLIAGALQCDDDPNYQSIDQKLDTIIANQEAILNALESLDEKVVKANIIDDLKDFLQQDWNGKLLTDYRAISSLDQELGPNPTEEKKAEVAAKRKTKVMFGLIGATEDTDIADSFENAFDPQTYQYGSYLIGTYQVVYDPGVDKLYGMYNQLLKYNYKWEHQAYDIKTSFQNACLGKYLTMVSLDRLSLTARIDAFENGYTDSKGTFHNGHGKNSATFMRQRLKDLNDQVVKVKELERDSLVKKRPDNVRYYQYPKHEKLIYAQAKHVYIPDETTSKEGIQTILDYLSGWRKGYTIKGIDISGNKIQPSLSFFRPLISYDYPNDSLAVSYDWLQKVYKDYGGNKSLKDIFGDKDEGGMSLPDGMDNSWIFAVDPSSDNPMKYWDGGLFRADRIYTPTVSCDAKLDNKIVYYYHNYSNEKPTDSYVKKFVSVGVVPNSSMEFDDGGAVGATINADKSLSLIKVKSFGKKKNKITIKNTVGANKYKVYACKCKGYKKGKFKKIKTVKYFGKDSKTITHSKLKKGSVYKYKVVAYSGKKKIATSKVVYSIAGKYKKKYSNVKKLTINNKKVNLSVGDKTKVSAKVTTYKNKKALKSAKKLRFFSSDKSIATVDKKGNVKAVSSGEAFVYVQSVNGIWKAFEVTVK